jgi:hypothetical protein
MRNYREFLKEPQNAEKLAEIREKDRIRKQIYRQKQLSNPKTSRTFKKKGADHVAKWRNKKKLASGAGYKSKSGLSKAVKRVEVQLPKDEVKKIEVIQQLNGKYLSQIENEPISIIEQKPITLKHQRVIDFYLRDDVSRQMPGMKDCKSFKTQDGKRQKLQVR